MAHQNPKKSTKNNSSVFVCVINTPFCASSSNFKQKRKKHKKS